ncbi:hypothetical protein GWK47_048709 [Chionoecetes opilio]|uniref:Uncharacterized protein n=1 Tax=Chionoecetes opilio TaxID=41210 RepID=A0A8J4YCI2_CHIOP|nr:hypothetical protein GWK47_048709 [Chionoecetes opilio]
MARLTSRGGFCPLFYRRGYVPSRRGGRRLFEVSPTQPPSVVGGNRSRVFSGASPIVHLPPSRPHPRLCSMSRRDRADGGEDRAVSQSSPARDSQVEDLPGGFVAPTAGRRPWAFPPPPPVHPGLWVLETSVNSFMARMDFPQKLRAPFPGTRGVQVPSPLPFPGAPFWVWGLV